MSAATTATARVRIMLAQADGNGGAARSTDWVSVTVPLGQLAAGNHTLRIGGFNNRKTLADESTEIRIDDVQVSRP